MKIAVDVPAHWAYYGLINTGPSPTGHGRMKMTITQKISLQVLAKIEEGMNVVDALKAVCGADKVDAMISDLYDTLRARA